MKIATKKKLRKLRKTNIEVYKMKKCYLCTMMNKMKKNTNCWQKQTKDISSNHARDEKQFKFYVNKTG